MRRAKKVLTVLLVVCMLCNAYGSNVLAADNGMAETVEKAAGNELNTAEVQEKEQVKQTEDEAADSDTGEKADEIEKSDSESEDGSDKSDETDSEGGSGHAGDTDEKEDEDSQDGEGAGEAGGEDSENGSDETDSEDFENESGQIGGEDSTEDELTDPEDEEKELLLTEGSALYATASGEVSRIEWLSALTDTFNMSVEANNYPDNYYSDINSSSPNYHEIMLATEFGLVDVEAGDALHPDDPATREFAAHTLNLCLGYLPEGNNYTFSESDEATYPDDIQIAINRGWFKLSDGKFMPDTGITASEKTAMLADAAKVLEDEKINPDYNNSYKFASDVIVLPGNIEVELTDDNELTIYNDTVNLQKGNKFAVVTDGLPIVFKASEIIVSEGKSIVTFEYAEMEEAFEQLDVEGTLSGNLAASQAYSNNVDLNYIVGGTEKEEWEDGIKYDSLDQVGEREISAIEAVITYDIPDSVKKQFDLGDGIKATITCKIGNVKPDYSVNLISGHVYFDVDAKATFSCNVSMDVLDAIGVAPTIELVRVPIALIGYFSVQLDLTVKGEVTLSLVENVSMGVHYNRGSRFRMTKNFTKDSFTIQAHAEVSAGVTATAGINVCNVLKGSIYGKFGAKGVLDFRTYDDGKTPLRCTHVRAWLYALVGCDASINLGLYKDSWREQYDIYSEKNSPVRVQYHFEDGAAVAKCTRDGEDGGSSRWKYYTPADSQYGYNGASSGTGSNGEPYTIFEYTLDKENNATITKYQGNISALNIPETLDGYTVVGIGNMVFQNNTMLRVVVIPDSVTEIGRRAFYNCSNLAQVTLSKGVAKINSSAFYNCDSLTSIEIPKSLNSIANWVYDAAGIFGECDNLKNVTFEKGTTKIVNSLFENCPGIEEITIPDTVTTIEDNAFSNCVNLCRVSISDSVTEIETSAFSKCANLSQVTLSKNLTTLHSDSFGDCDALTAIEIPKSLKTADYGPFSNCDNLKNVSFEDGITKIVGSLFRNCPGIEEIEIPDTITVIDTYAFLDCENLTKISIPDSVVEIGTSAFCRCTKLSQVTLSKNLTTLHSDSFGDCDALTAIEIPKSLKTADYGPFKNCENLKNVSFEDGITKIVGSLFRDCPGIEEIEIPDTVTVIDTYAFLDCENLTKISISDSVVEIGTSAFCRCTKLSQVTLSKNLTTLHSDLFRECVSLTEIKIPNSVTEMGSGVFDSCTSLIEVNIPNKLKAIKGSTFQNCSNLSKIVIPDSVTSMDSYAFSGCTKLSSVIFSENLESISSYAFRNSGVSTIVIPEKVTSIGNYAFNNCDALTKVVIPDSVTTLGTYIFADCEKLSDVTLGTGITTIPNYAFNLCPSLQKIVLPYRVTTINTNAFTNCVSLTEITIPRATTTIASSVFSYPTRLTIYGVSGTYAETYANTIGATFVDRQVEATEVKLNTTDLKLANGTKATLILSVTPSDFTDEVTWKSTDDSVVTVADTGVVTAKKLGTATIKVTVGNVSASCKVTVTQPVTSISLNKTSLSLEAWDNETLKATVSPSNAENKEVSWSTSNAAVAAVDDNGLVTALSKGTATITVTAQDGTERSRSCTVTVVNNGYMCTDVSELESEHNYPVNCSDFWQYTKEGAESLYITFDTRTKVEEDFDYLYIYDGKKKQIGKYTGTSLAGQTVEVPDDTVRIKLESDDSGTAWGFKVSYIMGTGDVENDQYLVSFDSQGGTAVSTVQVDKNTTVTEPVAPTKQGYEFLGWYLNGVLYDFTQPVTGNIVLQAKWKVIVEDSDPSEGEQIPEEDMPEGGKVPDGLWIAGVADQTYTGKVIKPEVRVYDGGHRLTEKTDYTISYKNNTKANDASDEKKAPTITVKGKGNYTGAAAATFKINQVDLNSEAIEVSDIIVAYNEKVQQKAPTVSFNGKKLAAKNNYTISYPDEGSGAYQDVGTYQVQLTGIGNYTGTRTVNLKITDKALIEKAKSVKITNKTYNNGETIELTETELILYMKNKNDPLTKDVDYTVNYENNSEIGTATAVITGIGDYAGTKRVTFKIVGTAINKATVSGIVDKTYNGEEQLQNITVTVGTTTLKEGQDYEVTYSKNVNVGKASLTIQGIGAYSGSIKKTFKITAYDLGKDEQSLIMGMVSDIGTDLQPGFTVKYVKGGCKPEVTLKFGDAELVKGTDFTISYKNNQSIADASANKAPTVTVKGKGNFKGSLVTKFSIVKKSLSDYEYPVTMIAADVAYAKGAGKYISKPMLTDVDGKTLKSGTDYTVSYTLPNGIKLNSKSTVNKGSYVLVTVNGKGKYEGSMMTAYRITEANFAKATVTVTPQIYTGGKVYLTEEDITVKLEGEYLNYGDDYEIIEDSYTNNIKKGTAGVKIRGLGNYGGTKTVKFKIQAKKMESFADIVRTLLFGAEFS